MDVCRHVPPPPRRGARPDPANPDPAKPAERNSPNNPCLPIMWIIICRSCNIPNVLLYRHGSDRALRRQGLLGLAGGEHAGLAQAPEALLALKIIFDGWSREGGRGEGTKPACLFGPHSHLADPGLLATGAVTFTTPPARPAIPSKLFSFFLALSP